MRWTKTLAYWLRSFFRVRHADAELDSELRFHLEKQMEANLAAGMAPREAREAALREFGGLEQIREESREARGLNVLYDLGRDVRLALRQLRRSPGFTVVVTLSLALGIGANTAVFTLVHAILLESLPVSHPDQLYRLGDSGACCVITGLQGRHSIFSYPFYKELRDHTPQVSELAAFQATSRNISVRRNGTSEPAAARLGQFVSGNYFALFGARAAAGRVLTVADDAPAAPPVAVLSYRCWQQDYGADPSLIGSGITINGSPFTVAGVTARGFFGDTLRPNPPDFWMPLASEPAVIGSGTLLDDPFQSWLYVMGRLKSDGGPAALQAQVNGELQQWLAAHPEIGARSPDQVRKSHIVVSPGARGVTSTRDDLALGLQMLFAASGLMLLIACANVASLLLARGAASRIQTAIQLAIGASRWRLVRQALTSSVVLALTGGLAGVYAAYAGARALLLLTFGKQLSMPVSANPSPVVLAFAFLLSLFTAALFGIVPAWLNSRSNPAEALRGAGGAARGHAAFARKALVAFQVALSLVLLAGAGLSTESLRNLETQRFGFSLDGRLAVAVNPALAGYKPEQLAALYAQIEDRLARLPGVLGVSYSLYSPVEGNNWSGAVAVEGRPPDSHDGASWNRIGPDYFQVVGTRLLRGRGITGDDTPNSSRVAVINETFARKYFPDTDPIGKHLGDGDRSHAGDLEIVGIVEDAKYSEVREPAPPMFFTPFLQMVNYSDPSDANVQLRSNYIGAVELHFAGSVGKIAQNVRRALAEIDPNLTVIRAQPFAEQLGETFTQERLLARLTTLFGLLALLLASIGLYGIMAYSVARRTNEIGLRMALGSSRSGVLWMVLRETLLLVLIGLAVGLPAAIAAARLGSSLLFGLQPVDPGVFTAAVAVLAAVALLAGFLPARRAARVDPMTALRYQ
jgi:predicted permease